MAEPRAMQRLALVVSLLFLALAHTAHAAASPPSDPLAAWLSKEGFAPGAVDRDASLGWVNVSLTKSAQRFDGDRIQLVREFAARAAKLEGLPPLDTVDLEPAVRRTDEPLAKTFRRLTLRLASPPLDGACIDPRVEVGLYDEPLDNGAYALPRATSLTVRCEKEPAAGTEAPADPRRVWPRAASAALPFVAICTLGRGTSIVIDKRGDVYSFRPHVVARTGRELSVAVRHGKQWIGALPPAGLDRLVALAPLVASARYQKQPGAADAPGTDCALLRAGANDGFTRVPLEENGPTTYGKRLGAAAEEARRLVHRDF